uniref:Uncharacterized protein n=1 Tax=viral metagenome TaxID=1070528 RepID=A0A6C0ACC2_9ZZZZ
MTQLSLDNITIIIIVLISLLIGLWSWKLLFSFQFEHMVDSAKIENNNIIGLTDKYTNNDPNVPDRCKTCTNIKDSHECFNCPNCAWDHDKGICYNCDKNCDCEKLSPRSCLKAYHCYKDKNNKCKKCNCSDPNTPCIGKSCAIDKNINKPIECGYCRNFNTIYPIDPLASEEEQNAQKEILKEACNNCSSCHYSDLGGCVLVNLPSANKENKKKCHIGKCKTLSRGDCEACPHCNFDIENKVCYNPFYKENYDKSIKNLNAQLNQCKKNLNSKSN